MNPKISVITVCWNAASTIERTIKSVIKQDYKNIEYIIVDGASTDGTMDIIKKYSKFIDVIISEKDNGIYDAMNKGIRVATGEWINFKNSGDYFIESGVLSKLFSFNVANEVVLLHGDSLYTNEWGCIKKTPHILRTSYKCKMPVLHTSSFIRSSYHKEHLFDLKYKSSSDYDFFYKLFSSGAKTVYIPEIVATFDISGFSNSNFKLVYKEDDAIRNSDDSLIKEKVLLCIEWIKFIIRKKLPIVDSIIKKYKGWKKINYTKLYWMDE